MLISVNIRWKLLAYYTVDFLNRPVIGRFFIYIAYNYADNLASIHLEYHIFSY